MGMRDKCPSRTFTGDDLTDRLMDDYRPYLKPSALVSFERMVTRTSEEHGGPVTRAEYFGFADGSGGYHTKWYWFGDAQDPECPDLELSNAMAGVERFPEE